MTKFESAAMTLPDGFGNSSGPVTSADPILSLIERGNALEEQGRPGEAMECYEAAVQADPRCARAHLNRGNMLLASERIQEAREAYLVAVACDPLYAAAHFNLANVISRMGEYEEALQHYHVAVRLKPDFADAFVALGNVLADLRRTDEARESYRRALAVVPNYADVHFNLALLALNKGEVAEAAECCNKAVELGTTNPMAAHLLAYLSQRNLGPLPGTLVTGLFDDYASRFDAHLTALGYSSPRALREAVGRVTGNNRRFRRGLDLGCGTGLTGARFKDAIAEITGVDLSSKMLEQAQRKQVYSRLDCSEMVAWLDQAAARSDCFDIVLAADVFVYIGDLEPAFKAIRTILADGGLFAFSVEHLERGTFELLPTFRCAHSTSYVLDLASRHGFLVEHSEQVDLRKDGELMIKGMVFVLARP